jgi:hypothetical protein
MLIAGLLVLVGLGLSHFNGQIDLTRMSWLWLSTLIGIGLFQAGITGFCPMTKILRALGAK